MSCDFGAGKLKREADKKTDGELFYVFHTYLHILGNPLSHGVSPCG